ncbi:MAG: hypothetical protein ISQ34_00855 [Rickettsiales bacterium]|nr:hypothetical protein [Rickettsiales bacterium]
MQDLIGYDEIIEDSMRQVIYRTLKKVEKSGLPGSHYFMITFLLDYPGVNVSKAVKEKYHEEVTVALQYQYRDLSVKDDLFEVTLSFGGKSEKLIVPYAAVTSFADPSMNFALKFRADYSHGDFEDDSADIKEKSKKENIDLSAKVISLDAFKKNQNDD